MPRQYLNVVVTQGAWTNADGTMTMTPPDQHPATTAQELWDNQAIPTYVLAFAGDVPALLAADELAAAGATAEAIAGDVELFQQAIFEHVSDIFEGDYFPDCVSYLPRVMILLDASSAMLNVDGMAGSMGETGWDQARAALVGGNSLFDAPLGSTTVANFAHFGTRGVRSRTTARAAAVGPVWPVYARQFRMGSRSADVLCVARLRGSLGWSTDCLDVHGRQPGSSRL
jgi:hypothetical protein